ncbi:MAG TPA: energy-coupling factor transporter transmembrane protein EcfT [Coriobacteriia bacterium]|jgi:energy-coupling factor transport system permease protein
MRFATGLGQYVPVASPLHALDARTKMLLGAALTASLFLVRGFGGIAALAVAVAVAVRVSRVPAGAALRGLRPVALLVALTLLLHAVTLDAAHAAIRVGRLGLDIAGLREGLFFGLRIVVLVVGTSLLTLTTTPIDLTDGLERLMRPLARLGVPAGDIAMMLNVALRFIPTTAEEAERVITAQQARGARFDEGGPAARVRAYVPVLVPLFVSLFRRADVLATAMEARCYRGGHGRTRLRESEMRGGDWIALAAGVALLAAIAVLG